MILDDYDMVTVVSEVQERNAYAAAAWRLQYERRAACPDLRDGELRARGEELDRRRAIARAYLDQVRAERAARQRELQRQLERRLCRVIPFRRSARR